jgi:lipoprotein-anchoring transpeptidase ErfK/SrfK
MTGRWRREWRRAALPWFLAGCIALSGAGESAIFAAPAMAQDVAPADGAWVDPAAGGEWSDIGTNVDQAMNEAWNPDPNAEWVDPAAQAPVQDEWVDPAIDYVAEPVPTYDANGNMIDPYTGAPLAIGADGNPIDAVAGLYFDEVGNLIDPATGLAVSYDANGQPILPGAAPEAAPEPVVEEVVPELVTTPWLAPPPSGPPPGFSWNPPTTVYIPETGQAIDGVFLDAWREWGGVQSWGNPITPEFEENGHIVQYYDFGRFEYHPENPGGVVQFGELGEQMQPFLLRRASGSGSNAANEAALAARAWVPLDKAKVRPDSETWRYVAETGHGVAGAFKTFWEATGGAGYLGNPLTEPYKIDGVTYQVFERGKLQQPSGEQPALVPVGKLAVERWRLDTTPIVQGEIPVYDEQLFVAPPMTAVGGAPVDPNGERWVRISISLQYLWAYQGDQVLWQGYVSTGTAKFATPTGTFTVLSKLPSQTMEGVLGGEYYNVPDVPDVMYFTDLGHAIHGTYWHSNFGTPMSHGCVNLPMDVADWMYQWSNLGMRVEIVP